MNLVSAEALINGWMTPSGTDSPPAEVLINGWMTPSGTDSPPAEVLIDLVIIQWCP